MPASACLRALTICSSVNLDFFIRLILRCLLRQLSGQPGRYLKTLVPVDQKTGGRATYGHPSHYRPRGEVVEYRARVEEVARVPDFVGLLEELEYRV